MQEDGAREDEGADEQEHQRIGERREDVLGRGDSEHDAGGGAQQRRDRKGQRLGDPEDDHRAEDGGEPMGLGLEPGHGDEQQEKQRGRCEHRADALDGTALGGCCHPERSEDLSAASSHSEQDPSLRSG